MPKRLTSQSLTLPELLLAATSFALPPSQRVYGWREPQIDRLFRDLDADAFAGETADARVEGNHWVFLGTVYLAREEKSGTTFIADGQQRVVTGTMIYAVARDLAEDADERATYHNFVADPGGGYRLRLRDVDAKFFEKWIQEPGATLRPYAPDIDEPADGEGTVAPLSESQNNIITNRNLIIERLGALTAAARRALLGHLGHCSELVVITATELSDATAAYASTYKRGLSQATTDRLKAECLGDADPGHRAHLGNYWDECEARIGKDGLEDLLYLLTLEQTRSATMIDLQSEVMKRFNLPADAAAFIEGRLVPAANAYRHITRHDPGLEAYLAPGFRQRSRAKMIADHLTALNRTTHLEWKLPALVALLEMKGDIALLETTMRRLERMAAAYMIAGVDPQAMIAGYAILVDAVRQRDERAIEQSTALEKSVAAKVRTQLLAATFATKTRFRMPVLLKLNDLMATRTIAFDPADVSCEHILPQNVSKENRDWYNAFRTPDGRRYNGNVYRHRLGNVTVLSHRLNRLAGSRPFAEKRPLLNQSEHAIARDCAKYAQWTADVIDERTERLTAMLLKHWDL